MDNQVLWKEVYEYLDSAEEARKELCIAIKEGTRADFEEVVERYLRAYYWNHGNMLETDTNSGKRTTKGGRSREQRANTLFF